MSLQLAASNDDTVLALALAAAVRSVGRRLGGEPRRVQAMVIDALGTRARSRRAEIDASVLAAEEGVPELLANGDSVTAELRLRERGLDADATGFAIDVWRYALGMLADQTEPPSLRHQLGRTAERTLTDRVDDPFADITLVADDGDAQGPASFVLQLFGQPGAGPLSVTDAWTRGAGVARSTGTAVRWDAPHAHWCGDAEVYFEVADGSGGLTTGAVTVTVNDGAGTPRP